MTKLVTAKTDHTGDGAGGNRNRATGMHHVQSFATAYMRVWPEIRRRLEGDDEPAEPLGEEDRDGFEPDDDPFDADDDFDELED